MNLLATLIIKEDKESLQLLTTMIEKETPSMKKSFELMTENYKHLL